MNGILLNMFIKPRILNYLVWCRSVFKSYEPWIGVSKVFMNIGNPCFCFEGRGKYSLTFKDLKALHHSKLNVCNERLKLVLTDSLQAITLCI